MGYKDYLTNLLKPLYVYNLDTGKNAAELETLGNSLDDCNEAVERLDGECNVVTAETYGLSSYEEIMPYIPSYNNLKSRRNAIMALLQIDDASFTVAALNKTLAGCGVKAVVEETANQYVVSISFPEVRGIPENLDELDERIKTILPCHIGVEYQYVYITWLEVESNFSTWAGLEAHNFSWKEFEIYYVDESSNKKI